MSFSLTERQTELQSKLASDAKNVLAYGGSRSGKTFGLCHALATRALGAPGSRHVIFRRYSVAVKQAIGLDTMPKVVALAWPELRGAIQWREQDGYFRFPEGSEIWLAGLDDKERVDKVLGKEFATLYFNEASEIPYQSYLVAQTRLAQQVKAKTGKTLRLKNYVDLNPTTRQHWTYRLWVDGVRPDDDEPVDRAAYDYLTMNPGDNVENLSLDYIESLRGLPERQRRRFYDGEYSGDDDNALWRRDMFKRVQPRDDGMPPVDLTRVVVAVDPAASNEQGSDETGIIACARGKDGFGYALEDASGRYRPEEWARKAVAMYDAWNADRIVAEVNNGGDMVEAVIRAQRPDVAVKKVHATRGKARRAEPVAALYERGKVFHLGEAKDWRSLEDQACGMTIDFDPRAAGWSPDRVDALVWGFTDLFASLTRKAGDGAIQYPKLPNVA